MFDEDRRNVTDNNLFPLMFALHADELRDGAGAPFEAFGGGGLGGAVCGAHQPGPHERVARPEEGGELLVRTSHQVHRAGVTTHPALPPGGGLRPLVDSKVASSYVSTNVSLLESYGSPETYE